MTWSGYPEEDPALYYCAAEGHLYYGNPINCDDGKDHKPGEPCTCGSCYCGARHRSVCVRSGRGDLGFSDLVGDVVTAQHLEIRVQQLEAENAWLRERHAEAVAQLQPTIEVLEGFPGWDKGSLPDRWWESKAKPHLDHLKALAKEAEV